MGRLLNGTNPDSDSLEAAKLSGPGVRRAFVSPRRVPRAACVLQPPELLVMRPFIGQVYLRSYELGWVKAGKTRQDPPFISNEELAEASVTQFLNLIRRSA